MVVSFLATTVYAVDTSIQGNAAGSQNSAIIEQKTKETIQQGNSATIDTTINATAKTGGNTVSGNTDGNNTIKTGDSTVTTKVTNVFGVNNTETECNNCAQTPTVKPTQGTHPTATPTPGPSSNGGNGGGGNGGGGNGGNGDGGSSSGGIGGANISGGEVMGLSATGGESTQLFFTFAGTVCLILGSALFNIKKILA